MRQATKKNNFRALYPDLAEEWHPTKNGDLTPDQVLPGSGRKVWWQCKLGHEWETDICHRTYGSQCPYCIGSKPSKNYNLAEVRPDIASQWHPTKNGNLTPDQVTPGSDRKVWWICEKGHEWITSVYNRKKCGCPKCARIKTRGKKRNISLAEKRPELVEEWHPTKNGSLTPHDVTYGSNKVVWWRCEEGHEWEQAIKPRSHGQNCPYCNGTRPSEMYNLQVMNPELAAQWHPTKNGSLTPDQVTPGSEKYIWWICEKGHVWDAKVYIRSGGCGCPECLGRRKSKFVSIAPSLAKEWHPTKNELLTPDRVPRDSNMKVWWICKKGHEWKAGILDRKHDQKCPICEMDKRKRKKKGGTGKSSAKSTP